MSKKEIKEVSVPIEKITGKIYLIRGQKVMLDRDLAELYQVETKQLKRAVRRKIDRFPADFMFELTKAELENLRCQFGTSKWGRTRYTPFAFTEPGVQFREIAKLFITSFDRPSFGESVDKAVVTAQETTQETTQEKIIACLKAEPALTRKLLAQRVGLSEGGVKYHLNKLKAAGKIRHVGPTKAGRWEVTDGRFGALDSRGVGGGHE
jgi:DNA-binding CsgD family transcriptional regulator